MIFASDLIEEFHKESQSDIPLKEFKLICSSPYEMAKRVMRRGKLEEIRIQYLFVIKVSPSRVIKHLRSIFSENSNISKELFSKRKQMLFTHIIGNRSKFLKYKEEIESLTNKELIL